MAKLLIATNNPGKRREFLALLAGLPAQVLTPADLGLGLDVQETGHTYAENARLISELRAVPPPRAARFVCVVAVAGPGLETRVFEGVCPGEVLLEERGAGGFGYDPLFFMPGEQATMAELPPERKNQVSHRARAVQAARPYLEALLRRPAG